MPIRKARTKTGKRKQIKREAEKLQTKGYSRTDAFGVATGIVTGKKPKRKRKKNAPVK